MARAALIRCSLPLPCPSPSLLLPASALTTPHPLPLLVTGSGVTVWAVGIGLAFWSVHLCQHPAWSLPSTPLSLVPLVHTQPSSPTPQRASAEPEAQVDRPVGKVSKAFCV